MKVPNIRVNCYTCSDTFVVPFYPVQDSDDAKGKLITPRLKVPFVCTHCRTNKAAIRNWALQTSKFRRWFFGRRNIAA